MPLIKRAWELGLLNAHIPESCGESALRLWGELAAWGSLGGLWGRPYGFLCRVPVGSSLASLWDSYGSLWGPCGVSVGLYGVRMGLLGTLWGSCVSLWVSMGSLWGTVGSIWIPVCP